MRVKSRLEVGLQNRRFVQMSKVAGERHRRWGVTAAFVLQVPALRRVCGLVETVVTPEDHDVQTIHGVKPPQPRDHDIEKGRPTSAVPDALMPFRDTRKENSCTDEVVDHSDEKTTGGKNTVHIETSVLVQSLRKASVCPNSGATATNATEDDEAGDCQEEWTEHQTSTLQDLKLGAHDSAIDSTGFFEVNDSDSNDGSESSCARLKRSTSQESVESLTSSVSADSWDMVVQNLNIRRSVSSDSLGSQVSSETDSALSTSEGDRSEDNDNDKRFSEDSETENKDELYAVDDRHAELLGAIRWTSFEDLLKVLRIHAEEDGYASAAGPGECVLQTAEPETSNIIQQAFLIAMTTSSEDDLESVDSSSMTSDTSTWSSSLGLSTQLLADCNSNYRDSLVPAVRSAVSEERNQAEELHESFSSECCGTDTFKDDDQTGAESSHSASSSASETDSSDSETDDTETDSLKDEIAVNSNSSSSSSYNSNNDSNNGNNFDLIKTKEQGHKNIDCRTSGSDLETSLTDRLQTELNTFSLCPDPTSPCCSARTASVCDLETSPTGWLQTELNTFSQCPEPTSPCSSARTLGFHKVYRNTDCRASPDSDFEDNPTPGLQAGLDTPSRCPDPTSPSFSARTLGLVSRTVSEVYTQTASVSADSSPSSSPEASVSPSRGCLELSFNSDDSDDSSARSPTSVHRRRHLISGYTSPCNLPSPEALEMSFLEDGASSSPGNSFDDSSPSCLALSPSTSSNQWPFSDVFTTPVSRAIIDESAEASRWLEAHSADSSTYSPYIVYGGRSSPPVPIGQCPGKQPIKPHFSVSQSREQTTKPHRWKTTGSRLQQESSSEGTSSPMTSSTPWSLKRMHQLVELDSPSSAELDDSEISFGWTERL